MTKQKKKTEWWHVALAIIIVLGPILFWTLRGDSKPTSTYEAHITDRSVVDPATLEVGVTVKNTGSVAAAPICTVKVNNAAGSYSGLDTFSDLKELQPGEQWAFRGRLTVTNQGAGFVTEGSVSCL